MVRDSVLRRSSGTTPARALASAAGGLVSQGLAIGASAPPASTSPAGALSTPLAAAADSPATTESLDSGAAPAAEAAAPATARAEAAAPGGDLEAATSRVDLEALPAATQAAAQRAEGAASTLYAPSAAEAFTEASGYCLQDRWETAATVIDRTPAALGARKSYHPILTLP